MNKYYIISSGVQISKTNENKFIVYVPQLDESYEIGYKEYSVLSLLDGKNDINNISEKIEHYSESEILALINEFEKLKMVSPFNQSKKNIKKKFNPIKIKLKLFEPNSIIRSDSKIVRILSNFLIYFSLPISLICFLLSFAFDSQILSFQIIKLPWYIYIIYALLSDMFLAIHEISHAIVARRYNMSVAEVGLMFYIFIPVAYTNINGLSNEKSKQKKLYALLAGSLSNLILSSMLLLIASLVNTDVIKSFLLLCFISNVLIIFVNCLIFIKYDGYYIFQILLNETFLREKSNYYLFGLFNKKKNMFNSGNGIVNSEDVIVQKMFYMVLSVLSLLFIPLFIICVIATWI